jgi:quinol monooxygenase YgiN
VLSVLRFRAHAAATDVQELADVLGARPGCLSVDAGRAVEDQEVWVVVARWADLGSCRRGLGSREVRMLGTALLAGADDAPSVFGPLDAEL